MTDKMARSRRKIGRFQSCWGHSALIPFVSVQAKLEGQQAALKLRLRQALRLAKAPRTHVDTLTVADKAIAVLDGMLEVKPSRHLNVCLESGHEYRTSLSAFWSHVRQLTESLSFALHALSY